MAGGAAAVASACGKGGNTATVTESAPPPAAEAPSVSVTSVASVPSAAPAANTATRKKFLIDVFENNFGEQMRAQPKAWTGKFRKMSAGAFPFYRGSAAVYHTDIAGEAPDPFVTKESSRVWIQGDLHADNFGTYLDSDGRLIFDVNDFDEAYVGPYTWDVRRLAASIALIGYDKSLSDAQIGALLNDLVGSYTTQVKRFADGQDNRSFALTLDNAHGVVLDVLHEAREQTRSALLDKLTEISDGERRFVRNKINSAIDESTRAELETAFKNYVQTIPQQVRFAETAYRIKDSVATEGFGIGSAGQRMYSLLLEGADQTLDNDVILSIKESRSSAVAIAMKDPDIQRYFKNQGQRVALSRRSLQAPNIDPWLGYTELNGAGMLVAEASPYGASPEWFDINDFGDLKELMQDIGRVVAKMHCIPAKDEDQKLVSPGIDKAILASFAGKEAEFAKAVADWSNAYAQRARDDHRLFADAFRNGEFPSLPN
jgi:uncharacterized protein (DUF2252 family)